MTAVPELRRTARPGVAYAGLLGAAALVAVSLGVYGRLHAPAGRPLFTLGFSGTLQMKSWLGSAALVLVLVQVTTALMMWGRLPGNAAWTPSVHRWSGTAAFVLTLPVALHCLWGLGFATSSLRVAVHGVVGCLFYGAYAAKMLALRTRGLPSWALPVLGGTVLASVVGLWLTSALWFFTRSGIPLR
ncbi:MAG: DUF6529 family protein [Mycobacteriales bacterium]